MNKSMKGRFCIIVVMLLFFGISVQSINGDSFSSIISQKSTSSVSPGDHEGLIFVDGRIRSYRYHIPQSYDGEKVPLVLALHGWPSNSYRFKWASELSEKSEDEGFIVVYPNGHVIYSYIPKSVHNYIRKVQGENIKAPWELGWNFWDQDLNPSDDVSFIDALISQFENKFNINSSRIYVCGISGGACMSFRLGAELAHRIAAIASVAGTIGGIWDVAEPDDSLPQYVIPDPSSSLPVIMFHGTADDAVYYHGGWRHGNESIRIHPYGPSSWIFLMSVNESVSFWVDHNNCNPAPIVEYKLDDTVIKETYEDGDNDSEVVLFTVVDGEHVWFGSNNHREPCRNFINDEMWEFFEDHSGK